MLWQVVLWWGGGSTAIPLLTWQHAFILLDTFYFRSVWQHRSLTPCPLTAERHWPPKDPRCWKSSGRKSLCEGWHHKLSSDGELLLFFQDQLESLFFQCVHASIYKKRIITTTLRYLKNDFCCKYWSEDDISIGQHLNMSHYLLFIMFKKKKRNIYEPNEVGVKHRLKTKCNELQLLFYLHCNKYSKMTKSWCFNC